MKLCNITLSIIIIVICAVFSIFLYKEHFKQPANGLLESSFNKDPNDETCWAHIKRHYKWNPESFTNNQKKVLMTMRRLAARGYEDNTAYYPEISKYCVIPSAHLPIFNKATTDEAPWDIYNESNPNPSSKGYMTSTLDNETPDGYKIDLTQHDQQSFQMFLDTAYRLYDKEFLDEKASLEAQIQTWQNTKREKEQTLADLRGQISSLDQQIGDLTGPNTTCQVNRREYEGLVKEYNDLWVELNRLG